MKQRRIGFQVAVMTALACAALVAQGPGTLPAAQGGSEAKALPDYQGSGPEQFLLKGKITKVQDIPLGVAAPRKVTLVFDGVTHQAVFKSIDVSKPGFTQFTTGGEGAFQDSWMTEIAAYQVDRIIGLGRVPATVERYVDNKQGSLQWWVVSMMPEEERLKKGLEAPDREMWNRERLNMHLFDNLIYNTDRNINNFLIANDWSLRLIDHSRSFRPFNALQTPKELTRFSRSLLEGIKKLEKNDLSKKVGKYLSGFQITALLQRRDLILALARDAVAQRGEAAVLFQ